MLRRLLTNVVNKNGLMFYNTTPILSNSTLTNSEPDSQSISDFYAGKSVFITGGTGFLGKVLIERLLYNCADIDKLYVLVREKKGMKGEQRLKAIVDDVLFSKLREVRPKAINKVVPIVGDMTSLRLGIKPEDENTLIEKVSVVFHSAADVRFKKPLKDIMQHNVAGTIQVLNLTKQIKNIKMCEVRQCALRLRGDLFSLCKEGLWAVVGHAYVHVSTAFSNDDKGPVIDQIVYPPPQKLNDVYDLIEKGEFDTKKILNGKVNTYTFSKAIAETVVDEQHGNIPTVIIRPSIVCCVKNEPLPGWIDNWNGYTRLIYYTSTGKVRVIQGKKSTMLNFIPVDFTINLMIAAAAKCRTSSEVKVYNSCASVDKSLALGTLIDKFGDEYKKITHENTKLAKIHFTMSSMLSSILTLVIHKVPAYIADSWLYCRGKEPRYMKETRMALTVRDILCFFSSNRLEWKIDNVLDLYRSLSQSDREQFPFHPSDISWNEYIKIYSKGVCKYLLADKINKK